MEAEDVFNTLAIYSSPREDLVIAVVDSFAAHDAYVFQTLALLCELSEALGGDVGAAEVDVLQESELVGDELGPGVVDLGAAQKVELVDELELLKLGDAVVGDFSALRKRENLQSTEACARQVLKHRILLPLDHALDLRVQVRSYAKPLALLFILFDDVELFRWFLHDLIVGAAWSRPPGVLRRVLNFLSYLLIMLVIPVVVLMEELQYFFILHA